MADQAPAQGRWVAGKPGRPSDSRVRTRRITFFLPDAALDQIDALATALNIPRAAVISAAVARMYNQEPVISAAGKNGKKK